MRPPLPPAVPGLPLLGNLLAYRKDHLAVFRQAYERLGPVFSIRLGPQRAVVLIGPAYHRFFFGQVDKLLSVPELYRFVVPMFGRVLNAQEDRTIRRRQLALLHSAFQGERMQRHVAAMEREVRAWLGTLGEAGTFELYEAFSALAMKVAASAFMGPEIRARLDAFLPLYEDLARGMEFVLPPDLPLPRFRRRDRARRQLDALLGPVLAERKAHPERYDDFLQAVVDSRDPENGLVDDETLVGFALMLVFTGYITTAAQACWSLVQLAQDPAYRARVRAEQEAVLPDAGAPLRPEHLDRMEALDRALKESQRMHPVMSHYARYNTGAYTLDGYYVPAGWLTMLCPAVAHRLPDVFARPDVYDPDRFAPGRAEDRARAYSLIGFSAGLYQCPGMHFGTNEMKAIIGLLLRHYDLDLSPADPLPDFEMGVIRPRPPCLVRYARRAPTPGAAPPETDSRRTALLPDGPPGPTAIDIIRRYHA